MKCLPRILRLNLQNMDAYIWIRLRLWFLRTNGIVISQIYFLLTKKLASYHFCLEKCRGVSTKFKAGRNMDIKLFSAIQSHYFLNRISLLNTLLTNDRRQLWTCFLTGNLKFEERFPKLFATLQNVRCLWVISIKFLDHMARAGTFQHMICRKATVADTDLHEIKQLQ